MASFGKITGFLISLVLLAIVIWSVVTRSIKQNLPAIIVLFIINIIIVLALPRILAKNRLAGELRLGSQTFTRLLNRIIVSAALGIVYVAGVGLIKLFSVLAGKRFLEIKPSATNTRWKKNNQTRYNPEEQF